MSHQKVVGVGDYVVKVALASSCLAEHEEILVGSVIGRILALLQVPSKHGDSGDGDRQEWQEQEARVGHDARSKAMDGRVWALWCSPINKIVVIPCLRFP